MKAFFIGLFTSHVVTKIVSLLLAIVLFVFTQQGISDTQRIDQLTIEFELDEDARTQNVVLGGPVTLTGLEISGLRKELVLRSEELRRAGWRMKKTIDAEFVRRHRKGKIGIEIVIDAEFCRREQIPWELPKSFSLELKKPGLLRIDRLTNRTFRPELSPDDVAKVTLPESSRFRGPGGALAIEPEFVTPAGVPIDAIAIKGPQSMLPERSGDEPLPLYIRVDSLSELLRSRTTPLEARAPLDIAGIDWAKSGCSSLELLRVEAPQQESPDALRASTLKVRCPGLVLNPIELSVTLPVRFATAPGGWTRDRIDQEYDLLGPRDGKTKFQPLPQGAGISTWTEVSQFAIKALPQWAADKEKIESLFAVEIDLGGAIKRSDDRLEIPVRLRSLGSTSEAADALREEAVRRTEFWLVYQIKTP